MTGYCCPLHSTVDCSFCPTKYCKGSVSNEIVDCADCKKHGCQNSCIQPCRFCAHATWGYPHANKCASCRDLCRMEGLKQREAFGTVSHSSTRQAVCDDVVRVVLDVIPVLTLAALVAQYSAEWKLLHKQYVSVPELKNGALRYRLVEREAILACNVCKKPVGTADQLTTTLTCDHTVGDGFYDDKSTCLRCGVSLPVKLPRRICRWCTGDHTVVNCSIYTKAMSKINRPDPHYISMVNELYDMLPNDARVSRTRSRSSTQ
jgi:hypothetical protein